MSFLETFVQILGWRDRLGAASVAVAGAIVSTPLEWRFWLRVRPASVTRLLA